MTKPKVFVTRAIPGRGLELVSGRADIEVWPGELPPPYEVLVEKSRTAAGLLTLLTDRIDEPLIVSAGSQLKVISQMAVGFDNIDITAATCRGIPVGNTPGVLTETTADFAWALLMAAARRIVEADRFTRAGHWKTWGPQLLLGQDLHGATLGLIGFGRIGQAVARRARGFGMRILFTDPDQHAQAAVDFGAARVDLETLLKESDFISLHTLLNPQTHHLIGPEQLHMMKPSAVLVNTSRGPVVDQSALYRALKAGTIAAAGLDVTETEPILPDDPLLELENLVIAPHIASASVQTRTRMAVMAAENLLAGLSGRPLPYCANPDVYSREVK